MKTKRKVNPTPADSTAVRIGGKPLQIAQQQAVANGMALRPTIETIILGWYQQSLDHAGPIGAAVIAKVEAEATPVEAAVQAIKERLPRINGKVKTGIGKPKGAGTSKEAVAEHKRTLKAAYAGAQAKKGGAR